jgi:hypothetical protein
MELQMTTDPAKFYGPAFTPERAENLTKAAKYLDMALRADTDSKRDMAMNAALKAEANAFA